MKTMVALCSALALITLSSAASAAPAALTDAQLDRVTAGAPPKNVQKDQAKRGDYPFGQRNSGKCTNNGQCRKL